MKQIKIGLAQARQTSRLQDNAETILRFVDQAVDADVQILCFPETQTVGYRVDITSSSLPVPVQELESLHQQVADRCAAAGMACVLGTEIPGEGRVMPFNSAIVISEFGEVLGAQHKTKLTPLDAVAYSPGDTIKTYELFGIRVGVLICFEAFRFAETTRECVRQGAQLVIHPQNNTTRPNDWKIPVHHSMIVTRAAENTIWFASCNACLEHQNSRSLIVAPDGRIHAQSELKREELVVAEIDLDLATRAMFRFDLEGCAAPLFADTVRREEYQSALAQK